MEKMDKKTEKAVANELGIDKARLKKLRKKIAKIEGYPERGIETWFRLASRNLYTRRQIVDTKSNILVTVNSIIISVILGSLYMQLDSDPHLLWAIVPMILTNVASIAFAIFATRPIIEKGIFTEDDVKGKSARLMTFDDFYRMPEAEYEKAVDLLMEDKDFLYRTIKKDLHHLGVDLSRRYKNIRAAYDIFLIGLVISLFMFGLCHSLF